MLASFFFKTLTEIIIYFLKILFIYIEREGKGGGERGGSIDVREKHPSVASCAPPTGEDLARNPGMCPDWESNPQPYSLQAGAQSTEQHHPGQC